MTTKEILEKARAKIERPECWTKGKMARDQRNYPVSTRSGFACRWCALGAIGAVSNGFQDTEAAMRALDGQLPDDADGFIPRFNDAPTTTHADILALYDKAIANAGGAS